MYQKISIIRSVVNVMRPFKSDAILLLVANPVDLLTSIAHELSGLPKCQVLGSGTFLDSVRIRGLLAEKTGVRAQTLYYDQGIADFKVGRGQLD
jgi:L-lactate dehydrogenase